ncbi:MAG: LysR substrate-binding domain-containing protein [Amphritea sp.]|nr:LysR substrate-binding domain-containing protein [Amphritea sp.]
MELIALKTFAAVAREGGILAASRQLNTVQSNITTRVQRLEEELGVKLFHRKGRGLELSRSGHILLEYAEQILQLERQAAVAVRLAERGAAEMKIGAMESFSAILLPQLLAALREICPKMKPRITAATTQDLVEAVLEHRLDCAFVGGPVKHPDLVVTDVLQQRLVLVKPERMEADLNLMLFRDGCSYRTKALQWRDQQSQTYDVSELGTLEGILGCVAQGLGVTLMPEYVVESSIYRDNLAYEPLPDEIALVPTQFIQHRTTPELKIMAWLFTALQWWPEKAG